VGDGAEEPEDDVDGRGMEKTANQSTTGEFAQADSMVGVISNTTKRTYSYPDCLEPGKNRK